MHEFDYRKYRSLIESIEVDRLKEISHEIDLLTIIAGQFIDHNQNNEPFNPLVTAYDFGEKRFDDMNIGVKLLFQIFNQVYEHKTKGYKERINRKILDNLQQGLSSFLNENPKSSPHDIYHRYDHFEKFVYHLIQELGY